MVVESTFRTSLTELQCEADYVILADVVIEKANWDTSKVREKLRRDIDAHVASVRAAKLSELTSSYEVRA